ncbi:hypothetical protein NPIL_601151 [Nephila pilipes]|uniref:Uncharacterized protein n=1 Tax=Nephila pilipes TaxID=299642 RepID=A0A8X6QAA5_NEPPI|nr:hypothetical protein NPIL_601151 [Nephila pilipes]
MSVFKPSAFFSADVFQFHQRFLHAVVMFLVCGLQITVIINSEKTINCQITYATCQEIQPKRLLKECLLPAVRNLPLKHIFPSHLTLPDKLLLCEVKARNSANKSQQAVFHLCYGTRNKWLSSDSLPCDDYASYYANSLRSVNNALVARNTALAYR